MRTFYPFQSRTEINPFPDCSFSFFSYVKLGCGELIDKTDCSCNIYPQGGHLLCHDDVIGTRRVSYIIYLTDPDEAWKSEDGGALALYDCIGDPNDESKKLPLPKSHPIKRILPLWNSMMFFAVLPGKSFHDIEEVVVAGKPRLSISGWFHGATPPEGSERATLNQILVNDKSNDKGERQASTPISQFDYVDPFVKLPTEICVEGWLAVEDVSFLSKFINAQYLHPGSVESISQKFVEASHIQLHKFLNAEVAASIFKELHDLDEAEGMFESKIPSYSSGQNGAWVVRGPTHKQRYLEHSGKGGGSCQHLPKLKSECFDSEPFQRFLSCMTKVAIKSKRSTIRRFRPGLDYTLAHSGVETSSYQLDATLCLVEESEQWGLGEVGGYDCYMVNDSEAEGPNNASAEVYRVTEGDEDDETITLPAARNCLNLVLCNESVMRFTKYLSSCAPGSRYDILSEYLITPQDDSDDDSDDKEGGGIDLA